MNADDVAFLIVHDRSRVWLGGGPGGKVRGRWEKPVGERCKTEGRRNNRVQAPSA